MPSWTTLVKFWGPKVPQGDTKEFPMTSQGSSQTAKWSTKTSKWTPMFPKATQKASTVCPKASKVTPKALKVSSKSPQGQTTKQKTTLQELLQAAVDLFVEIYSNNERGSSRVIGLVNTNGGVDRQEIKGKNIRVNCISPGGIFNDQPQPFIDRYNAQCNIKGMLDGKDVAGTIVFLLSDLATHLTGQNG